jgi:hypothetical protein
LFPPLHAVEEATGLLDTCLMLPGHRRVHTFGPLVQPAMQRLVDTLWWVDRVSEGTLDPTAEELAEALGWQPLLVNILLEVAEDSGLIWAGALRQQRPDSNPVLLGQKSLARRGRRGPAR